MRGVRGIWAVLAAFALPIVSATAADEPPGRDIPAPFAPLEHLIGGWKGVGIPSANKLKGWPERHLWAWKFAEGHPVGMTVAIEGGKILDKGHLSYDAASKRYSLEGTDPAGKPVAFAGRLDERGKALIFERADAPGGARERLTIRPNSNLIRYSMWLDHRDRGAPQFSREIEVGVTKEGEAFAAGSSAADVPKCIITGGASTMTVSYNGASYPICCTGCRDEFLENPEKYLKKAALRTQAAESAKTRAPGASAVVKDDGAFDGLVDDAPARRTSRPSPATKPKADAPATKPADSAPEPTPKPSAKAASLLRQAQALEKAGKPNGALGYYRKIVDLYPDSSQAKTARERIKALEK